MCTPMSFSPLCSRHVSCDVIEHRRRIVREREKDKRKGKSTEEMKEEMEEHEQEQEQEQECRSKRNTASKLRGTDLHGLPLLDPFDQRQQPGNEMGSQRTDPCELAYPCRSAFGWCCDAATR